MMDASFFAKFAPKVAIREILSGGRDSTSAAAAATTTTSEQPERGLFATQDIYQGERLLVLPKQCLLSEGRLYDIANADALPNLTDGADKASTFEARLCQEILKLRQALSEQGGMNLVLQTAQQQGYQWRSDDAVALFLIAMRKFMDSTAAGNEEGAEDSIDPSRERPVGGAEDEMVEIPIVGAEVAHEDDDGVHAADPSRHVDGHPTSDAATQTAVVEVVQALPTVGTDADADASHVIDIQPSDVVVAADAQAHTAEGVVETPDPASQSNDQIAATVAHQAAVSTPTPISTPVQTESIQDLLSSYSFQQHVELLPRTYPTNPLYFTPDELERLEGTNCHAFTVRLKQQLQTDWQAITQLLRIYRYTKMMAADNDNPALDDDVNDATAEQVDEYLLQLGDEDVGLYQWALCTIYSRSTDFASHANAASAAAGNTSRVIAPVFDMMNHDFDSPVTHAMDDDGNLSVFNHTDAIIPAGTEICLNYGNFPNEKFLLIYGFVVKGNPNNAIQLYAPLQPADPFYAIKVQIMTQYCDAKATADGNDDDVGEPSVIPIDPNQPHLLTKATPLPMKLIKILRIMGIQTEEGLNQVLQLISSNIEAAATFDAPLSRENEISALSSLSHALQTMARQLALNLISDDNLKAAAGGSNPLGVLISQQLQREGRLLQSIRESDGDGDNDDDGAENDNDMGGAIDQTARHRTNLENVKELCRSEYEILQLAIADITSRMEKLEP